ncbi:MAG: hypothetical protein LQ346_007796 [Caloplaca aetnensis]|nr:MAG: hypothetical protein LQ346_007796 [Caloplaca aetnensis]
MSTFTALNIEPESDNEDEIDNSKEIQIEEALKLYQNALKLHSQGPRFYAEAEEAYSALFQSEVFTYLESLPESQRIEYYPEVADDASGNYEQLVEDPVTAASADGVPSTLPQILYLSYKNHGHFLLDRLKWRLQVASKQGHDQILLEKEAKETSEQIASSLKFLVEALDRDDTDVELWRQLSKIGESLGSKKIARFCLEAVLDREKVAGDPWSEPLGLQELFAAERLRSLLQGLGDDISEPGLPRLTRKQQNNVRSFRTHLDPLPYLPTPPPEAIGETSEEPSAIQNIAVPLLSWASCGKAILLQLQQEAQGLIDPSPGTCYVLTLPNFQPTINSNLSRTENPPRNDSISQTSTVLDFNGSRSRAGDKKDSVKQTDGSLEQIGNPKSEPRAQLSSARGAATSNTDISKQIAVSGQGDAERADLRQNSVTSVDAQAELTRTMTLPTRKRSNEATELEDAEDTGRSKSKRIKARTSIDEPASGREARAKQQLELYQQGELEYFNLLDGRAFEQSASLLSTMGIDTTLSVREQRGTIVSLVKALKNSNGDDIGIATTSDETLMKDLTVALCKWNGDMSNMFLQGGGFEDPISGAGVAQNSGLLTFLEQSGTAAGEARSIRQLADDKGLDAFVEHVNTGSMQLEQIALAWVIALLSHESVLQFEDVASRTTAYEDYLWPDNLKETLVQVLVRHDDFIFRSLSDDVSSFFETHGKVEAAASLCSCPHTDLVQNIFELHLDVYGRITNPSSEVDPPIRTTQLDRLQRWASLAYQIRKSWNDDACDLDVALDGSTSIRFLWACAVLANLCSACPQDLIILYFRDLQSILRRVGSPVIQLRNNAVMPEISIEAAEKQISRLTTMDFFTNVFSSSDDDPAALIETLEPLLERSMQQRDQRVSIVGEEMNNTTDHLCETDNSRQEGIESHNGNQMPTEQMLHFLDKASLPMQLMLWRKLIDAYSIIDYSPRILWCYLRCITLTVNHLQASRHSAKDEEERRNSLLRWLKSLDDLLTRALALAWSDGQSLDCMDEVNLQDALSILTRLQYMLLPVVVVDDCVKIGLSSPPSQSNNSTSIAYSNSLTKLCDMIVRTWTLRYILIRDGLSQFTSTSSVLHQDLFECLTSIHRCLGPRNYCRLADRVFLKLARRELSKLGTSVDSEIEGAQIILDMYGLKICPGSKDVEDHGCPAETMYRSDAVEMMDRVLVQANKLSIKDLIKSDMRVAVERMQQAIRIPKNTSSVLHNRRILSDFLKRPINPRDLSWALRGLGELHFQQTHGESFRIAEKGWYFLQGQLALVKFRSQKRSSTAGSDELDVALKFFEYDLEQGYEKWETWYRLAQVYDAKIEEETTWTADNLNTRMDEVIKLQRSAIHCYTMAVATAERCPEPTLDMFQKVADLYSDFGIRIYGSSREPFAMKALSLENFTKHYNSRAGTWQDEPFRALSLYGAWRFAGGLLRRALVHKPDNWVTWYMLGKCLWKMHKCSNNVLSGRERMPFQPAIDAFKTAIEALPGRRDSKHADKDPTLEPHYKLASVVHKLVSSRRLTAEEGCETLNATSYARKVPPVQDVDDWEGYILSVLKVLRGADKANWHHRMALRSARTIYEESPNDHMATLATKLELTQQIFTKTMTVQVWKPENERTGRHFVYTTRYVEFFLRLLYELNDRAGLEALGKQIRKKPGKFFGHTRLWHETCMTHLKLLRSHSSVPDDMSDSVFKNISHDLFVQNADRLEAWAHLPSTDFLAIDILREAIELKKTNSNLMKPAAIEDFIADAYAALHLSIVPELIARSNEEESRGRMRVDNLMNLENPPVGTPSPGAGADAEDAAPTRQRIRGVGRRELQKRAEALVNKPAALHAAAKAQRTPPLANGSTTPRSTIQVLIPQATPMKENNSSVPGSVHDSADDESELSEVEDAAETARSRPMFPNLEDSKDGADEAEEEEKERSEEGSERADDEQLEEEDQGEVEGEGDGEETYHTPMEM